MTELFLSENVKCKMIETNNLYNMNCLEGMKQMIEQGMLVDLIVTDPPYLLKDLHKLSPKSDLAKKLERLANELSSNDLIDGINEVYLKAMWGVMKVPNIYLWCNGAQIPQYIEFFVTQRKCKMDIIVWHKTNAMPLFYNKYLSDKEYCLYFRKSGYCNPLSYEKGKTVYELPLNVKDKKLYGHPTVKPLKIIRNLVENSSKEGNLVLDPFMGSGTTAVACKELTRQFVGFELNKTYFESSLNRLASVNKKEEAA